MRRAVRLLAALAALALAAGPAGAQGGKPAGTFRGVFTSDPPTLDPAQATDTTSSAVVRQIFDTLVELDEHLEPRPGLAERWTISSDGRTARPRRRSGRVANTLSSSGTTSGAPRTGRKTWRSRSGGRSTGSYSPRRKPRRLTAVIP